MPLNNYSVLRGRPLSAKVFSQNPRNPPHCHIQVSGGFDVAVNIESTDTQHGHSEDSRVLYLIDHGFAPDNEADLLALADGLTPLDSEEGGLALDYVRTHEQGEPIVTRDRMSLLPIPEEQGNSRKRFRHNDLHNEIIDLVNRAVADEDATIFAFGSAFTGGDQGIHDIHMNQGNPRGDHSQDNGIFQDGALLLHFPGQGWVAVFVAFQTQSFNTDDEGNPITGAAAASGRE